jgi:phage terminase large subunit-like protein
VREVIGEYNFAGQYQQAPAPAGGGLIKTHWFKTFRPEERPKEFELIFQSWDTANKSSELSDYSVDLPPVFGPVITKLPGFLSPLQRSK